MRIVLLEPFMGGSHALWAKGLIGHSRHTIDLFELPGRHWKWRMHGAAPEFSKRFNQLAYQPDLVLATDLMDLAVFCGLSRKKLFQTPVALYFHENQLCYPWSDRDPDTKTGRNRHYAFINVQSALAADYVFFSSNYQKNAFFQRLPEFLHAFPDFQLQWTIDIIREKSSVLPLGLDLPDDIPATNFQTATPILIWNHRWEYDKNPELFFQTLFTLAEDGLPFQLIVCGEHYGEIPAIFNEAKTKLQDRILHWGYCKSLEEYRSLLQQAHIAPVTSNQDFFGISAIESAWYGAIPLLPKRLAYPEIFGNDAVFYAEDALFESKLREILSSGHWKKSGNSQPTQLQKYQWKHRINEWDNCFETLIR
jgi:glycosyltransferase involved in cell wall biosynthesis